MRRREREGPPAGMPGWLVEYRPELWADDLEDPLEVYYFGRFRWTEALAEWLSGGTPAPRSKFPRPVAGVSANTSPISEDRLGGTAPRVNRADVERRSRPIKLH